MHSNGELLGTLCGKRQDAALVWIINILLHSLACISRLLHANSCNKVYLVCTYHCSLWVLVFFEWKPSYLWLLCYLMLWVGGEGWRGGKPSCLILWGGEEEEGEREATASWGFKGEGGRGREGSHYALWSLCSLNGREGGCSLGRGKPSIP